ncbi:MAG: hypothetical protein IPM14_01000 [bacterium]|nr:hypothetical protein [bacterium]
MKTLKEFLLPSIKIENTINLSFSDLKTQGMVVPDCYYIILDETTRQSTQLINLKLNLFMDASGDYFLIVDESSEPARWNDPGDMSTYFNNRIEQLNSKKKNIIVTSEIISDEFMLIQFYVFAGKGRFADILALIKKIKKQITDFREGYQSLN